MSYDRSLSLFSPTGNIAQLEYASSAVSNGLCAVGVNNQLPGDKGCIILAVEKKSVQKLMDPRTVRKTYKIDDHCYSAFAGLSADARVLINRVQLQCQSFRLSYEDRMDIDFIVRHLAELQQKATQSGGRRPYGVAWLVAGFNADGTPQLWMTEPSGQATQWKAAVTGGKSKPVHDSLETNWKPGMSKDECIKLTLRGLLEVVDSGAHNIELVVIEQNGATTMPEDDIAALSVAIEKEMEEERAKKRRELADD